MSQAATSVLILSSDTGGGHRSAASALEDSFSTLSALMRHPITVTTRRVLEETTWANQRLASFYNYLLRHRQDAMKYYYWFINKLRPDKNLMFLRPMLRYGQNLITDWAPNVLVSVHPMMQHFFGYVLDTLGLAERIPIVAVVTDPCYGFWEGWASPHVQRYYVASEGARQQLIDYGIKPDRIQLEGIPVHANFAPCTLQEQRAIRESLQLDPERFTVLVNAGWIGGGNIEQMAQTLMLELPQEQQDSMQVLFIAGSNQALRQSMQEQARHSDLPVHVLGSCDSLHHYMNASDVMVSKFGGLTTFEALASGLPIIGDNLTLPMPQEAHTSSFIDTSGAGLLLNRPTDLIPMLQRLQSQPDEHQALRAAALKAGRPGASQRIAEDILSWASK